MYRLALLFSLVVVGPILAQPNFKEAETFPPDEATRKKITEKTAELRHLIQQIDQPEPFQQDREYLPDVLIYLKAAEWIVKFNEWTTKDAGQQTVKVLDAGIARAKQLAAGQTPWRKITGKPVIRGYRSKIDGSIQPYSVTLPEGFFAQKQHWRMDVVLHGRDGSLTEVKFINSKESSKGGSKADYVIVEPYGRGNNAYRWAGEVDVEEAIAHSKHILREVEPNGGRDGADQRKPIILRGFSMGGAGTWHLGLHKPFDYTVISPGAGFTTTRGYIKNLPEKLPDYQEKTLRIYDAVLYAENAFNVPVVAYSGGKDPQKAAADNIENALKGFKHPLRFTHVVAPDLEHKLPPEWQAKLDIEYRKYPRRMIPEEHTRFVTYTLKYNDLGYGYINGVDKMYEKTVVETKWNAKLRILNISTINASCLFIYHLKFGPIAEVNIDGQAVKLTDEMQNPSYSFELFKFEGKWRIQQVILPVLAPPKKWKNRNSEGAYGPIDDAFMHSFLVNPGSKAKVETAVTNYTQAAVKRMSSEWDRYFRGELPTFENAAKLGFPDSNRILSNPPDPPPPAKYERTSLVLFGTPETNPEIAKVLPKLPIKWTKDELVVNGAKYDAKTHLPVLIYPAQGVLATTYVVINSGHTFHEADFKGTNALLYPRLGDWAVLKPTPTAKDPAAAEVVAAGLFDENWQFEKK